MQQFILKVCKINPALHLLRPTVLIPLAITEGARRTERNRLTTPPTHTESLRGKSVTPVLSCLTYSSFPILRLQDHPAGTAGWPQPLQWGGKSQDLWCKATEQRAALGDVVVGLWVVRDDGRKGARLLQLSVAKGWFKSVNIHGEFPEVCREENLIKGCPPWRETSCLLKLVMTS